MFLLNPFHMRQSVCFFLGGRLKIEFLSESNLDLFCIYGCEKSEGDWYFFSTPWAPFKKFWHSYLSVRFILSFNRHCLPHHLQPCTAPVLDANSQAFESPEAHLSHAGHSPPADGHVPGEPGCGATSSPQGQVQRRADRISVRPG